MKKIVSILLLLILTSFSGVFAGGVEKIDKDELKAMLDSPELALFDVRKGRDWSSSEFKIKGAIRITGDDIDKIAMQYSKDKTIVLYCA